VERIETKLDGGKVPFLIYPLREVKPAPMAANSTNIFIWIFTRWDTSIESALVADNSQIDEIGQILYHFSTAQVPLIRAVPHRML
jgi:hypothetical protein